MPAAATPEGTEQPRRLSWLNWKTICIGFVVATTLILAAIQGRNIQQWSRVRAFRRNVEQAGGKCFVRAAIGTDFLSFGATHEGRPLYQISWPIVTVVELGPESRCELISWKKSVEVGLRELDIKHPRFGDAELAELPDSTPLSSICLRCPRITNASVAKLLRFPYVRHFGIEESSIDAKSALRLLNKPRCEVSLSMTIADLRFFLENGVLEKICEFELERTEELDWDALGKDFLGRRCALFRGDFGEGEFDGAHQVLRAHHSLKFVNARIPTSAVSEIGRMRLYETFIVDSVLYGEPAPAPLLRIRQEPNAIPSRIYVRNSKLDPRCFQPLANQTIELYCEGDFATVEWLSDAVKTPGLAKIYFHNPSITDEALREINASRGGTHWVERWKVADDFWKGNGFPP